jgi:hypothetical protein
MISLSASPILLFKVGYSLSTPMLRSRDMYLSYELFGGEEATGGFELAAGVGVGGG